MNAFLKYSVIVGLLLVLTYTLGPVIEVDETIEPVLLPDDVETFIRGRESQFPDIRPQTKKTIQWTNSS